MQHIQAQGSCRHEMSHWGRTAIVACRECGLLQFFGPRGPLDPAEGMAALFGNYDLVGPLTAVGAPAPRVLAYRPNQAGKGALALLPPACWLAVGDELWVASDGQALLLATPNQLMVDNLTRGA
ncbi:MAG TPA: hypothetical protein VHL52_05640 [Acidimicrobiia bacterium]|nr:hypothetical protein [Acidimicrobiia bacterium]